MTLYLVSLRMLSVTVKPIMLDGVIQSVGMLRVTVKSVMLSIVILSVFKDADRQIQVCYAEYHYT